MRNEFQIPKQGEGRMKKFRRFLFGTLPVFAALALVPSARAVTEEEFLAILEAEMDDPVEATAPYARPEFDDSAWGTVVLPPAPDAPPPWPEGADGTIWYRRRFVPEAGGRVSLPLGDMEFRLGAIRSHVRLFFNGFRTTPKLSPGGVLFYGPWHEKLQPGTNTLVVAAPVHGGQGGIPSGNPADMEIYLSTGINALGEVCEYIVTDECTIPLAGEWRCLFVPAAAEAPEGGAK
jgi:hypothetical protein